MRIFAGFFRSNLKIILFISFRSFLSFANKKKQKEEINEKKTEKQTIKPKHIPMKTNFHKSEKKNPDKPEAIVRNLAV